MSSENEILSRDETKSYIQEALIEAIKAEIGESGYISFMESSKRMSDDEILERYPTIFVLNVKISKTGSKKNVKIHIDSRKPILTSGGGLTPPTRQSLLNWGQKAAGVAFRFFLKEDIHLRKVSFFLLPDAMRRSFQIPNLLLENLILYDDYSGKVDIEEYLKSKMLDSADLEAVNSFTQNVPN